LTDLLEHSLEGGEVAMNIVDGSDPHVRSDHYVSRFS
jgi:hypothetical protein